MPLNATFPTREAYLLAAVDKIRPLFETVGALVPEVRVSTGWPSSRGTSKKNTAIGECWDKAASADGVHQIFISPLLDDVEGPQGVLSTLIHELVHASVGIKEKHGAKFRGVAESLGLEGPMTSTHAGEKLLSEIKVISVELGNYPHARLEPSKSGRKKQGTRMIKCECPNDSCGYTVRTTRKWLEQLGAPLCPASHGRLHFEMPEEISIEE